MADGLIASGLVENVLLHSRYYSKIIDPDNQSVAPLFGDAAVLLIQKIAIKGSGLAQLSLGQMVVAENIIL